MVNGINLRDLYRFQTAELRSPQNNTMFNINAKVFGDIILKTLSIYPELFVDKNTLGDVFATVLNDASILSVLTNATGITKNQIETTIDSYLEVDKLVTEFKEELAATKNTNR